MLLSWMQEEKTYSTVHQTMGTDEKNVYVSNSSLITLDILIQI